RSGVGWGRRLAIRRAGVWAPVHRQPVRRCLWYRAAADGPGCEGRPHRNGSRAVPVLSESSRSKAGPGATPGPLVFQRGGSDIVAGMKRLFLVAPAVLLVVFVAGAGLPWAQSPSRQAPSASSAPLQAIVGQVVSLFPRVAGEGNEVHGTTGTLSIGKREGLVPGAEMTLFREGRELRHPKTGEILGKTEKELGRLRIEQVQEAY